MSDRAVCARFDYAAEYGYGLGKKKSESEKRLQGLASKISTLDVEKKRLEKREKELGQKIKELQAALLKAGEAVDLFVEFIEKEKDYQDCRGKLADVVKSIEELEKRKVKLTDSLKSLQGDISGIERQVWQREKDQQEALAQLSLYQDAPEAETLEGSIAELEERLKALKEKYSWDIKLLEKSKKDLAADCGRKQKELDRLGLQEEEYAGVLYDEPAAERVEQEIDRLDQLLKVKMEERVAAAGGEGAARNALDNALIEVKRLGAGSPLPPEEIKGDFDERLKSARIQAKELEAKNHKIAEQVKGYGRIREKIERLVDPNLTDPEKGFIPEQDIAAQAAGLEQAFGKINSENSEAANRFRNKYAGLKADYRDKNSNILASPAWPRWPGGTAPAPSAS